MRKACIDVGSNSLLLLVEERTDSGWRTLQDCSTVTALGEGVKQTGVLAPEAMQRTLSVLKSYFELAKSLKCDEIHAAGTMAVRMAQNQVEFLELAAKQQTPISVLSGEDEARLGLESVIFDPLFAGQTKIAVIDPGGQSTEITLAERTQNTYKTVFSHSFPIGTLGIRSNFMPSAKPNAE